MAKVTLNPSLRGLSGTMDDWVFRQVDDRTVVSPRYKGPSSPPSPAQLAQRQRFGQAKAYAKIVLAEPAQRRAYMALAQQLKRRVDRVVLGDFLTPPVVEGIELYGYKGRPGDVIRVIATDDVEVVSVNVAIRDAEGEIIEEGPSTKVHGVWVYTTTLALAADATVTVEATATDRPGNAGRASARWPART